jgi:hypothetical protein
MKRKMLKQRFLRAMGDLEWLDPKESSPLLTVNSQYAFPVDSKEFCMDRTWPRRFWWFQFQNFALFPTFGFPLIHDAHRAQIEATFDLFEFHGGIFSTGRAVI